MFISLWSHLWRLLASRALQTHTPFPPPTLHCRSPTTAEHLEDTRTHKLMNQWWCGLTVSTHFNHDFHAARPEHKHAYLPWEGQELSSKGGSSSSSMYSSMYIWSEEDKEDKEDEGLITWFTVKCMIKINRSQHNCALLSNTIYWPISYQETFSP